MDFKFFIITYFYISLTCVQNVGKNASLGTPDNVFLRRSVIGNNTVKIYVGPPCISGR